MLLNSPVAFGKAVEEHQNSTRRIGEKRAAKSGASLRASPSERLFLRPKRLSEAALRSARSLKTKQHVRSERRPSRKGRHGSDRVQV